jgi:hypothetical protein
MLFIVASVLVRPHHAPARHARAPASECFSPCLIPPSGVSALRRAARQVGLMTAAEVFLSSWMLAAPYAALCFSGVPALRKVLTSSLLRPRPPLAP